MESYNTPELASAVMLIDTDAIHHNWQELTKLTDHRVSAVVKANAYNLGIENVVPTLYKSGCRVFFVATISEALATQGCILAEFHESMAQVYVFDGVVEQQTCFYYSDNNITPILNTPKQFDIWLEHTKNSGENYPCAIQLDSGMGRLGLNMKDVEDIKSGKKFDNLNVQLIMTHLACADEGKDFPKNKEQKANFDKMVEILDYKQAKLSLSATDGLLLGEDYYYDFIRTGIGLYNRANSLKPILDKVNLKLAVELFARIISVKQLNKGESVGYDATYLAQDDQEWIGTVSFGYADGIMKKIQADNENPHVIVKGKPAPIVGTVSMDYTTIKLNNFPNPQFLEGDWAYIGGDKAHLSQWVSTEGEVYGTAGRRVLRIPYGHFNPNKKLLDLPNIQRLFNCI